MLPVMWPSRGKKVVLSCLGDGRLVGVMVPKPGNEHGDTEIARSDALTNVWGHCSAEFLIQK